MKRTTFFGLLALMVLFFVIAILKFSPRANAAGMMGVGSLMNPRTGDPATSGSGEAILQEDNSGLLTEAGSPLRKE